MIVRDLPENPRFEESDRIPTTGQVVVRIAIIVLVAEFLIMWLLSRIQLELDHASIAFLDGAILLVLSTLPIYLWVIRPFVRAHERSSRHIAHMAYHDALTALPNRRLLFEHLGRALAACERHGFYGALLLVDLDGFKAVNDDHGHDAGDALLVEIGRRLDAGRRQEDIVGRLGGDEFLALAQHLDADLNAAKAKAETIARNLQRALARPVEFGDEPLRVGASIGIRLLGPERQKPSDVVREADEAMYRAKKAGGGNVIMHVPRVAAVS